jgi:hypothetical protein
MCSKAHMYAETFYFEHPRSYLILLLFICSVLYSNLDWIGIQLGLRIENLDPDPGRHKLSPRKEKI